MRESSGAEYSPRTKWVVLFVFSFNSFLNGEMYMNFAGNVDLIRDLWGVGNQGISWLYSSSFIAIIPIYGPIVWLLRQHNLVGIGLGVVAQVVGAAVRVLAVSRSSYSLAIASSVLVGIQSACVVAAFVQLVERWFPLRTRPLATQIVVQANYAGWATGTLLVPFIGTTKRGLTWLLIGQAVLCTAGLLLFLCLYEPPPALHAKNARKDAAGPEDEAVGGTQGSVLVSDGFKVPDVGQPELTARQQLTLLLRNRQYLVHLVCHSTLTGIGFAIPAVQDQGFDAMGFSPVASGVASFVFIISGVVFGLAFGYKLKTYAYATRALPWFYHVCCAALLAMLGIQWLYRASHVDALLVQVLLTLLMVPAGAASLAMLGVAMNVVVVLTQPVDELFASATIELGIQVMAAALTQLASGARGYFVLAMAQVAVTLTMALFYRVPSTLPEEAAPEANGFSAHEPVETAESPLLRSGSQVGGRTEPPAQLRGSDGSSYGVPGPE